jgi:CRP/FNR family transcriptional regulator, cyclic AMP receptor protein
LDRGLHCLWLVHVPSLAAFSEPFVKINRKQQFSAKSFLAIAGAGRAVKRHPKGEVIFSQADPADALFYIQKGKVKLTVISSRGKQAVIAILGVGDFFGEGCLAGQLVRMSSAAALGECSLMQLEKAAAMAVIHKEPAFSGLFLQYVLSRNIRIEEDLVDQLFNSSEKRLARILLLLANFGKEGKPEPLIANISQETLAEMIGTTRSRVSFFMNKFRKLGFIDYNGGLQVHSSLLTVVLLDQSPAEPGNKLLASKAASAR